MQEIISIFSEKLNQYFSFSEIPSWLYKYQCYPFVCVTCTVYTSESDSNIKSQKKKIVC